MKRLIFGIAVLAAILCLGGAADLAVAPDASVKLDWQTDLPKALVQAKAENKLVLLNFTGSDWCAGCKVMDLEVFSQPEFAAYAQTNLMLVEVDLPNHKMLPPALLAANKALNTNYDVVGFPTLIALQPDGTVAWRMDGFSGDIGPQTLITPLQAVKKL